MGYDSKALQFSALLNGDLTKKQLIANAAMAAAGQGKHGAEVPHAGLVPWALMHHQALRVDLRTMACPGVGELACHRNLLAQLMGR